MQESLKPIEAGCLAVVTHSDHGNAGKIVRVKEYLGLKKFPLSLGHGLYPAWKIAEPLPSIFGLNSVTAVESQLMRIDGFEGELESNETEIKHEIEA